MRLGAEHDIQPLINALDDVEKVFDLRKVKKIFFEEDANFFKNFGDDGETSEGHTFFVELMKAILDKGHNDGIIELKRIVAVAAAEQDEPVEVVFEQPSKRRMMRFA